jgi:phosphoglycolate phosphatase
VSLGGSAAGHVVFDLDGTLVDSVPLITSLLNAMLADRGESPLVSEAEVRPHVTAGGPAMIEALLRGRCGETASALTEFRARYAEAPTPMDSVYPGAREALETLAGAGYGLAVCSNKTQALCDKVLGDVGLAGYFGAIVGTGPEAPLKPDPTGYRLALSRSGGHVGASCLVGDSDVDLMLARRAGVPVVLATWGYGDYDRVRSDTIMVDGFAAVPGAVARVLSREASAA